MIFEDEGFSAKTIERPKFQEMLRLVKENSFHILVCYRLDRISRNVADFSNLIHELSKHNISFISIKEQFDTSSPMGRAMMYIASVFAQLEREVIAERIRDNLLELSKSGTWLGGDSPLGFSIERFEKIDKDVDKEDKKKHRKASKLVINEEELEIYFLIVSKYEQLKSLSKLETYLMNQNIKTRKGKYYSCFSLKWILSNAVYVKNDKDAMAYFKAKGIQVFCEDDDRKKMDGKYGFLSYNKTSENKNHPSHDWILSVGLHPGILDGKRWVAIQALLEKNKDKRYRATTFSKKQTIASGLIRCKECGSYMRPRNMDKKRKDGTVNYSYCCVLKEKSRGQKCTAKNVKGEELDRQIFKIIKETSIPNSEIYKELVKMSIQKNTNPKEEKLKLLENEKKKIQSEIEQIIDKLKYIDIDLMDLVNNNLRELKCKQEEIEQTINALKSEISPKKQQIILRIQTNQDILKIIDLSFHTFESFDLKTKRDIAKTFIESIYACGSHVEINFLSKKITESTKNSLYLLCQK